MLRKAIPLSLASVLLAGCLTTDPYGGYSGGYPQGYATGGYQMPSKQTWGTLGGAAGGGLLGSQFGSGTGKLAATGLGVFLGALAGNSVGSSLDKADAVYAQQAAQQAFATNQQMQWQGQSGNYGVVTPGPVSYAPTGQVCREYQHKAYIGGRAQQVYGQACQQHDGSWQIVG